MMRTALAAAEAAGRVLLERFEKGVSVQHKGPVDLVTEADRLAEETIVGQLRKQFPDHDILAEEADHGRQPSRYRWIIDPLDGTTNFAHGFPWFAISIALTMAGEPALGIIYNPFHKALFRAEKGQGAFLNDVKLHVSATDRLDQSLVATGFPYDRKTSSLNNYDHFVNFQQAALACRRAGAASLDLAYVAAGSFDGYWEMKLQPWDMAAGILLVEEAGGRVSDFTGGRFDLFGAEILASNGRIHQAMIDILRQGKQPGFGRSNDPASQ